ncbi:MAG: glycine zipper 2TM domain-containing protein [Burkholderiales bacterium]
MEAQAARPTHPLIIIAAIAVTLFSLVGIGAVLGWIPTSGGIQKSDEPPAAVAEAPAQATPQPEAVKPAEPKPVVRQAKPRPVARVEPPREAAPAAVPPPPPIVAALCRECAVIEEIREVEKAGSASGVGAVGGAVVGGVLGHQVGRGRGKDVATVLGAIGGSLAGNQIEKNAKKTMEYQIFIRYENGSKGMFVQPTPPSWRLGDKVKVIDGALQSNG